MTRRRLILFLVGLGIMVALYFGYGAAHMRAMRRAWYWNIGTQLILTTNSPHLAAIGPGLHSRLTEFLSSPATVESVTHGDAQAPIGDGTAMAHIILKNAKAERLGLRIARDDALRKDRVVGFWTPTPP